MNKTYKTKGTESEIKDPETGDALEADEVLDEVSYNANLNGYSITYKVLMSDGEGGWKHLQTDVGKHTNHFTHEYYTIYWGGYVKKPLQPKSKPNSTKYEHTIIIH